MHPVLQRESISSQLHNLVLYPLTLVVAAMGYGKTTAVRDYLQRHGMDYLWLSISEDDASPQYLWSSLMRQLTRQDPEWGRRLYALGYPSDRVTREQLLNLLDTEAGQTPRIIVIDDYHRAHAPELDRLVELVVRANIPHLHLVLIARARPDLNIAELRLKHQGYLLRSDSFEMTPDDVQRYFALFGHPLSSQDARKVHSITEGWISGVYLILQRYIESGHLDLGSDVGSLIEQAIMARYSPDEVHLLTMLSLLDHFTPEQAMELTGSTDAARTLQRLSAANSFLPFDEGTGTYRMHNIFRNHLRHRQTAEGVDLAQFYRQVGEFCVASGDTLAGLRHFLRGGAYNHIFEEFSQPTMTQLFDTYKDEIVGIFRAIPSEVKWNYPLGHLRYIDFHLTNVEAAEAVELLADFKAHHGLDGGEPRAGEHHYLTGEVVLVESLLCFNDLERMHQAQLRAHALLGGRSRVASRAGVVTFGSPHNLFLYHREPGKMRATVEFIEERFHYYCNLADGCGTGLEYASRAEYCLEVGDTEQAELYAHRAIARARSRQQAAVSICSHLVLARAHAARGRWGEARQCLEQLDAELAQAANAFLRTAVDLCRGYMTGLLPGLTPPRWLREGTMNEVQLMAPCRGLAQLATARAKLAEQDYVKVQVLAEEMRETFAQHHLLLGFLHAHLLEASATYALRGCRAAVAPLSLALAIGRADGIVLPFAEYGRYVGEVLRAVRETTGCDPYLDTLIAAADRYHGYLRIAQPEARAPQLSGREIEVLELILRGYTNREIAAHLHLAEVTVRKNITSTYRKLGVRERTSAVKKALELGWR